MIRAEALRVSFASRSNGADTLDLGDLTLAAGARACVVGGSGSGKTTLLHVLAGLVRPSAGRVWHGDTDLFALPEAVRDRFRARHVGYVFQSAQLLQALDVTENVALAATLGGATRREARDRAEALLQRVGLGHRRTARPGTLSVGEQQRVGIARALVSGPAVVLADEPTASLDERRTDEVLDLLDEVVEEAGATLLLVTHEPRVRDRFQTVLSLDEGPLRGAPS
tara:strand:- start:420 stop:1094 length:675 start_codon:yes stop_codon:yes gene_type:complete